MRTSATLIGVERRSIGDTVAESALFRGLLSVSKMSSSGLHTKRSVLDRTFLQFVKSSPGEFRCFRNTYALWRRCDTR